MVATGLVAFVGAAQASGAPSCDNETQQNLRSRFEHAVKGDGANTYIESAPVLSRKITNITTKSLGTTSSGDTLCEAKVETAQGNYDGMWTAVAQGNEPPIVFTYDEPPGSKPAAILLFPFFGLSFLSLVVGSAALLLKKERSGKMLLKVGGGIFAIAIFLTIYHGIEISSGGYAVHEVQSSTPVREQTSTSSNGMSGTIRQSSNGGLTVEGVVLGPFQQRPRTPERNSMFMLECEFHDGDNKIIVTFSDDGTKIIHVDRYQAFNDSDYAPKMLLAAAVNHYGKPAVYSPDNRLAVYGNAFTTTQNGDRIDADWANSRTGLEIKVHWCSSSNPLRDLVCNSAYSHYRTYVAEYELLDARAYHEAEAAAKIREQNQQNADDQAKQRKAAGNKF
jgi:hypothetical protein